METKNIKQPGQTNFSATIMFVIAVVVMLVAYGLRLQERITHARELNSKLCEYSKWDTKDAHVINGVLYCRSNENSIQKLYPVVIHNVNDIQ